MGPSKIYFLLMLLFSLVLPFQLTHSFSSMQPLCHREESSALWQFKESFVINKLASYYDPSAYPKVASWELEEGGGNCCLWDGVECDEDTGHVIGLDLSGSCLYGSINSSSSLFRLTHLQKLNLAFNNFNFSQIPSQLGNLSWLTNLNLSYSLFNGQIPSEISMLSKLSSLALSYNSLLELKSPDLRNLVQNLTSLKHLDLSWVDISSPVPHILANLSSLTSLILRNCRLIGEFPTAIFHLPKLQYLHVPNNPDITGRLPEFHSTSHLKSLWLNDTGFSGKLPASIGNLCSLEILSVGLCKFSGLIPSSLSNLTHLHYVSLYRNNFSSGTLSWLGKQTKITYLCLDDINLHGEISSSLANLTQLAYLYLSGNQFAGKIPSSFANLNQLAYLGLSANQFAGKIPSSFANLTKLVYLELSGNHFTGQIPSWFMNLTQLRFINFALNNLQGPIPTSISELKNLQVLDFYSNDLSGTMELDTFLMLRNLFTLHLSLNKLSLLTKTSTNASLPKFAILGLASCNLSEFPSFLKNQDWLQWLDLSVNNIHGVVPNWIWNMSIETLQYLDLAHNSLKSFGQPLVAFPWTSLRILNLSSNILQGSLPIPPFSTIFFSISNNSLTGEISPLICNMSLLQVLDLSNNNLSGKIPQCLSNFSNLTILNLQSNNFCGTILQTCSNGSKLIRMINLGENKLQGQIPRSLAQCTTLEILDLGNNQINDTFPFWLGTLPELKILILRSNGLHGAIRSPEADSLFPKLRIVDLSSNNFIGKLPSEYIRSWKAMKIVDIERLKYMQADATFDVMGYKMPNVYFYSMTMTNKGINTVYEKIIEIFIAIDLSCNRFEGEIPEFIGNLKELQLLNLSNNILNGHIPLAIQNLTKLESLDLSQNKLSGDIPQQLKQLTFLEFFNVSNNHLTGPIPRGNQFDTFQNNSYNGNPGLCGNPLSIQCGNTEAAPEPISAIKEEQDTGFLFEFDWKIVLMGYGTGLLIGLLIGHTVTTRKHEWFMKTFGSRQQKRQME